MVSSPAPAATARRDTLQDLVDMYLDDKGFVQRSGSVVQSRVNRIEVLKRAVEQFITGASTLTKLSQDIDRAPAASPAGGDTDTWGIKGRNFMEALGKLAEHHDNEDSRAANRLRELLNGLNVNNLGARIELFHAFLMEEEQRFRREGRPEGGNVAPGYSALIISLFAYWLNSAGRPTIYYQHLGRGLKMLLDVGILTRIKDLRIVHDRVEVQTQADHLAFQVALQALASLAPQIKVPAIEPFWADRFMLWLVNHPYEFEEITRGRITLLTGRLMEDEPLAPLAEAELQIAINELRRRVLIDEKLVRRIYHALLAGHVILTGPPGTGKTELAKLLPEILWGQKAKDEAGLPWAYTTRIITATDEWSVHTLLGGIVPRTSNGQVSYCVQYGYLTDVVRKNWLPDPDKPHLWHKNRITSYAQSKVNDDREQEFRGQWLVIDEFNRAPIDLALGEVLTTLSASGGKLHVPTDDGEQTLPLPRDFRIIGTLNSFDRNYLNQISEALKRRFSFIEILPPTRQQRDAEQNAVLHAALSRIKIFGKHDTLFAVGEGHLSQPAGPVVLGWEGVVWAGNIHDESVIWSNALHPFHLMFDAAWRMLEVIRIYRQLGTAQAITLFQQILIAGFVQEFTNVDQWYDALDDALCDVIADQLQVLMPDELNVLYWYVKRASKADFIGKFNEQLLLLHDTSERRLRAQLEALSMVITADGTTLLSEADVERLARQANAGVEDEVLTQLFALDEPFPTLPQFARRLRTLRAERGL